MSNPTLVFRADGNTELGMGHFVRSLALVAMLKADFVCVFACSAPSEKQINRIAALGCPLWELPKGQSHFDAFLQQLEGTEVVILDNYFFDTAYQQSIVDKGCKLVCIDDMHEHTFAGHAIINHAPNVVKQQYTDLLENVQYCLGPAYALLRPAFVAEAQKAPNYQEGQSCFICFGGADKYGMSLMALEAAADLDTIAEAHVVLGNAPRLLAEAKDAAEILEDSGLLKVNIYQALDEEEMLQVMRQCQMAIVPASSIMYEVMCVGMPIFGGYYVDNQKGIYEGFLNNQTIFGIGNFHDYTSSMLASAIAKSQMRSWASEQVEKQHHCIDGKSPERFKELFRQLVS